jgi:hypothetical protein
MLSRHRQLHWLLFFILSLWSPVEAQKEKKPQLTGERDKGKEDVVAKIFETIRVDEKLPALIRITHRDELEEAVCTVAQVGTFGNHNDSQTTAFYKTAQPDSISAELSRVASFKEQLPANRLAFPRYSVAVWQMKDSQGGETQYWVGVQLYWSVLAEFVDYHFTDDVFYHNEWKKDVARQCRGK